MTNINYSYPDMVTTDSAATTSSSYISTESGESLLKTLTSSDLQIIGWVLWVVIIITLFGNFCSFYAVFDYQNFKKIMTPGNPYLLSNVLCATLSFVDFFQIILVGIPAAICFSTTNTNLASGLYNLGIVDPLLDLIVWTQLLLVVAICLDRAFAHICRPITYYFKPYMMVLSLLIGPAVPFFTLTLPYILAARVTMQDREDRGEDGKSVFLCSNARINDENGEHIANIYIFMSCTLQLGTNWEYTALYQTWENVSNPLVLLLAVAALAVTCGFIVRILIRSARFQMISNNARQEAVARSIRKTCTISMVQAALLLVSSLPLRCYQIRDRLCPSCGGFSVHYTTVARLLVFLGPMFNSWLYAMRMGNVRKFLSSKKKQLFKSAHRQEQMATANTTISRVTNESRGTCA